MIDAAKSREFWFSRNIITAAFQTDVESRSFIKRTPASKSSGESYYYVC